MDEFWWFASLALACALYLTAIVIVHGIMIPSNQVSEIQWFSLKFDAFGTIPIYIFAFTCHQNVIFYYIPLNLFKLDFWNLS